MESWEGVIVHRYIAGTCRMDLRIVPLSSWAVGTGVRATRQSPDVRLKTTMGDKLILPASSVKGVVRSTAEHILRSLDPGHDPDSTPLADTTFGGKTGEQLAAMSRSDIADSDLAAWRSSNELSPLSPKQVYPSLSLASQVFGATSHAGLMVLDDIHVKNERWELRPRIAIDRFSGGVAFTFPELYTAPQRLPAVTLSVANFAFWQIGLLAIAIQEINSGYVGIGKSVHKGHGRVDISIENVTFEYPEAVNEHPGEILSAQGWIASQAGVTNDVPIAVRPEAGIAISAPFDRHGPADWREDGLVTLVVRQHDVPTLMDELVQKAWLPLIRGMREVA